LRNGVKDLSPLRDEENRWGKHSSAFRMRPWGSSAAKIDAIFPCNSLRLLLKLAHRRRPRHWFRNPRVGLCLRMPSDNGTGGSRLPISGPGSSCRLTPYPPLYMSSAGLLLPPKRSMDLPCGWLSIFSQPPCSVFPDKPGRGLKPRRRQYFARYGQTQYRTIYCRRAKRLLGEDAVSRGLASATTPRSSSCEAAASLLPAWTYGVGVLVNADGGGGSLPYHSSAVDAISCRRPPRPRFLAALGPLSS
jgi:hypothetical protein